MWIFSKTIILIIVKLQITKLLQNFKLMKISVFLLLLTLPFQVFTQEILLEEDVKADTVIPTKGPNLKHYTHLYAGVGFPVFTNEAVAFTKPGYSSTFDVGIRYKRKLNNNLALGLDLGAGFNEYVLKQYKDKFVPDTVQNKKEKFRINTLSGSAFVRINVGKRGNSIGNYIDLGAFAGWNLVRKHKTINDNEAGERVKVITSGLKYVEVFAYGLQSRIGFNRYAVTARCRLSDIFTASSAFPELPRLIVGVEVGLFK